MNSSPASGDRALIALQGGPKDKFWYWQADWELHVRAVEAQRFPVGHPANAALHYRPTGRHVDNPNARYGVAEVWWYDPPGDVPVPPEPIISSSVPERRCVSCANRLLLHRAGRDRCARCHSDTQWWSYLEASR